MPDTAEHRADMYRLSRERQAAGKPVWDRKINVAAYFHQDGMTFEQSRDGIVGVLRASGWFKNEDEFSELHGTVEELAAAENTQEFDAAWDYLYDLADDDRVWISTF